MYIIIVSDRVRSAVQWDQVEREHWSIGIRIILNNFKIVKQITWHGKGDYFATVMPDGQNRSVLINQLSKRRSQLPFSKSKGLIQCVLFHPIRPYLFVAVSNSNLLKNTNSISIFKFFLKIIFLFFRHKGM